MSITRMGLPSKKNRAIDAIRFVAALLVVLGHVRILMFRDYADLTDPSPISAFLYATTSLGSQAVMVFFVLSGFWVGGQVVARAREQRFDVRHYALSRLSRLWLVLIPALALTALVDWVGSINHPDSDIYATPSAYSGIDPEPSHSLLTLLGNVGFVQDIHVLAFGYNHPLWSLSYEFWYYVLFPAIALAATPRTRPRGE